VIEWFQPFLKIHVERGPFALGLPTTRSASAFRRLCETCLRSARRARRRLIEFEASAELCISVCEIKCGIDLILLTCCVLILC
jgi:hypothetical protein